MNIIERLISIGRVTPISEKNNLYMYRINTYQRLIFSIFEDEVIIQKLLDAKRIKNFVT